MKIDKKELIELHFSKENLVKNLTSYILYYQIALGKNVYETLQDQQATINKLKELNLSLNPNEIIGQIFDLLLFAKEEEEEDISENFEKHLQKRALLHSLEDFVNNDKDLLNKQSYYDKKQEVIISESFFDSNMKMQYLKEYPKMLKNYENSIDDGYYEQVKAIILKQLETATNI